MQLSPSDDSKHIPTLAVLCDPLFASSEAEPINQTVPLSRLFLLLYS